MEELYNQVSRPDEERRDDGATAPAAASDAATIPRHLFTMTVEDVAVMLADHYVPRDQRTIQRWCKRGKLKAIIDHEAGDRYLIEPGSARQCVATLVAEKQRQDEEFAALSRQQSRHAWAGSDRVATDPQSPYSYNADKPADVAHERCDAEAADDDGRDLVATLKAKVSKLEEEVISLRIDKQARDQVLTMVREEYQKAIDHALDRSERVGALEAENRHLRQLLPADRPEETAQRPFNFAPRSTYGSEWREGDKPQGEDYRAL